MNLRDGHVGPTEFFALVVIMLLGKAFLGFPARTAELGGPAAWTLPIMGAAVALVGLWAIARTVSRAAGKNLVEAAEDSLGPVGGLLAGGIVAVYTMGLFAVTAREFTEAARVEVLPETPTSVILVIIIVIAAYGAYRGLQVVARTAWLGLPVVGLGIGLTLLLTLPYARPGALTPLLGPGPEALLAQGVMGATAYAELLALGMIAPFLRRQGDLFGTAALATGAAALALALVTAQLVMAFSPDAVAREAFPLLRLTRLIFYGRFLQRLEAPFVVIWVTIAIVELAFWLYASALALASAFRMPVWRPLVPPLAMLGYALAFIPAGITEATQLEDLVLRGGAGLGALVAFPLALWLAIRRRRLGAGA